MFIVNCSLLITNSPLTPESILRAVHQALDVGLVLNNDKHAHNDAQNHLPEIDRFKVVGAKNVPGKVAINAKNRKHGATADAPDRDILCRKREENPHAKRNQDRNRVDGEEHAQSSQDALTAAETGKASKAVAKNHEEASDKRNPGAVIGTTGSHLGGTHLLCDERAKEALQQIHEHDRERGLPAQNAEGIRKARILGTVVPNVEVLTLREFCDPYGAGDRPQQVRYWKTQ